MVLQHIRKEAKRWLKALQTGDAEARARFERACPNASGPPILRDVQHALAREYEHESWIGLKRALTDLSTSNVGDTLRKRTAAEYDALAQDTVAAFDMKDEPARVFPQHVRVHYTT